MRTFPLEFEAKKEILFYPDRPEKIDGDILEIGPGRGDFLMAVAEQFPQKKLAAIELGKKRHYKLIPRIEKRDLSNILLIQGNARIVIPRHMANASFKHVYVLFPDPWPKKRHFPHRLMTAEFMDLLSNVLCQAGNLFVATDYWPYASWVVDNARQVPQLKNMGAPYFCEMSRIDYYSPTFFEQKWRDEGRAIYYMHFKKT